MKEVCLIGGGQPMERKNHFWLFDTRLNQRIEAKNVAWLYCLGYIVILLFRVWDSKPAVAFSVLARCSPNRVSSLLHCLVLILCPMPVMNNSLLY